MNKLLVLWSLLLLDCVIVNSLVLRGLIYENYARLRSDIILIIDCKLYMIGLSPRVGRAYTPIAQTIPHPESGGV